MILFDFDGTLSDTNGIWEEIDLTFLRRRGLSPTREYTDEMGHSIFPAAAQFTRNYYHLDMTPQAIMDEWLSLAWETYAHTSVLKDGALDFLRRCQETGETMALCTACVPTLCHAALARHGLSGFFTRLIFAEELGLSKSDPAAFLRTAELLGVSPADCTLYDDSPTACAAARRAGMTVVGVYDPYYHHRREELKSTCHRYITSFIEER